VKTTPEVLNHSRDGHVAAMLHSQRNKGCEGEAFFRVAENELR
jgi:hypothetical protein